MNSKALTQAKRWSFAAVLVSTLGFAATMAGLPILTAPAAAQDQAQFSDDHLRLAARYAELSGANLIYITALNAQRRDIIRTLTSTNPDIAPMITEVTDAAYLEMADATAPLFENIAQVYAGVYSADDLVVINAFFESETGQRFLESRRAADQASFEATIAWGDSISVLFLDRVRSMLRERGIDM